MYDSNTLKKNKVTLSEYNYRKDLENRLLMSSFTLGELEALKEILYSSLSIPFSKLSKNLNIYSDELIPILRKLSTKGLLTYDEERVNIDKEIRKYYETHLVRFEDDFRPGMEYLQALLKNVPIHVLPSWYAIPRTSNNIFDSIVEKYLITPSQFQRYLDDIPLSKPYLAEIIQMVYTAPGLAIPAETLIERYSLSREEFQEDMLYLEFNLVCCLSYRQAEERWIEMVTPFAEWADYLRFLKETEVKPIVGLISSKTEEFQFIKEMGYLLKMTKSKPISIPLLELNHAAVAQILSLQLAENNDSSLTPLPAADRWLRMSVEEQALSLYRCPHSGLTTPDLLPRLCTEKNLKEVEKAVARVASKGWVYFSDFLPGVTAPINDHSPVTLKKVGKCWKYVLPSYTKDEKRLIEAVVFDLLYQTGMVAKGFHDGRQCFSVTRFGQSFFQGN